MKRALIIGMSAATAIAVSLPALVMAQDFPPPPPSTYYGTVAGGTIGQGVIAIVSDGTSSQTCGDGVVVAGEGGAPSYVVDVIQNAQKAGCGSSGRTIRFYFTPTGGNPGRLGNESATWGEPGAPKLQNVTLGASLTNRKFVPVAARDGIY